MDATAVVVDKDSLAKRSGVLVIGSSGVGKRTLLSRLLSVDFEDDSDSSSEVLAYGWTINTKYYTADVSMWMAHLFNEFSITGVPMFDQITALVMVFDLNNQSSFSELKKWVSCNDIGKFDILLCIGNKADLVVGHSAHIEYRRHVLNQSSEYGIEETEGSSLLEDESSSSSSSLEIKKSCMEWCLEHNIEYIEACASNPQFDKCLSVDGDSQGVERLLGALSAHMWPGMILKSGQTISQPSLPQQEDSSDEEPNYEFEYEILSAGSIEEQWDDSDVSWVSATKDTSESIINNEREIKVDMQPSTSTSTSKLQEEIDNEKANEGNDNDDDGGKVFEVENMEQLMSEIGNVRDSLRLMPDFQRREMAANLAMKMASMFGDSSGDEGEIDE
ncbi:unnamed protein product [Lactuca virosa]|uniref:Uncharacterized protein n=1 Tax=Lactuca virosa TaxID=75947 RepID=A0AAU9NH14_9ASTR|nr:unnamed protein product [Lactuca virosa]